MYRCIRKADIEPHNIPPDLMLSIAFQSPICGTRSLVIASQTDHVMFVNIHYRPHDRLQLWHGKVVIEPVE